MTAPASAARTVYAVLVWPVTATPSTSQAYLLVVAAVPLLSVVTRLVSESSPDGSEGPGLGALLGGSTGVVILPLALLAVLFFAAGALGRAAPAPTEPPVRPSTPAARS